MPIRVVGPRDQRQLQGDWIRVDTTSQSTSEWTTQLSPFFLGPCRLYGAHSARIMENAWQFAKVYRAHVDADDRPTAAYWQWAKQGWSANRPVRYPMGKGAKPEYLLWNERHFGYVEGRHEVYWPLYRDAVRQTRAFARLQSIVAAGDNLALFDFDGYDHDACAISLSEVLLDDRRPMGHAFVLKAMLLYGPDVSPEQVIQLNAKAAPAPAAAPAPQLSLFGAEEPPPPNPLPCASSAADTKERPMPTQPSVLDLLRADVSSIRDIPSFRASGERFDAALRPFLESGADFAELAALRAGMDEADAVKDLQLVFNMAPEFGEMRGRRADGSVVRGPDMLEALRNVARDKTSKDGEISTFFHFDLRMLRALAPSPDLAPGSRPDSTAEEKPQPPARRRRP